MCAHFVGVGLTGERAPPGIAVPVLALEVIKAGPVIQPYHDVGWAMLTSLVFRSEKQAVERRGTLRMRQRRKA